jgi:hypothetical protein
LPNNKEGRVLSREVIVPQRITGEEALELLTPVLAPRYELTRTLEDDELYVSRFPGTRVIVKVAPLPDGRTSFQARADDVWWSPALFLRLIASKQVARAIAEALN